MSMALMVQAMGIKIGSPSRKLILLKLADNANDAGECYPSYQNIADHCEMSKRAVIGHIRKLREDGFLELKSRKTRKGTSSNLYKLTLEISEKPSSTPSEISAPPPVQNLHPPSEISAPPPGAESAPRISHSFESVIESKESKKKKPFLAPGEVKNLNLSAWEEFEQHRKSFKPALTDLARKKLINKIAHLPPDKQQACIDLSIENGWKGLFPEKQSNGEHGNGTRSKRAVSGHLTGAAKRAADHHEFLKREYAKAIAEEQGGEVVQQIGNNLQPPVDKRLSH